MKKSIILSSLIILNSCSLAKGFSSSKEKPIKEAVSIDLFAARGFLGGSEYERYHLNETTLWKECGGVISSGKSKKNKKLDGDKVFSSDPQLDLEQRRVDKLNDDQLISIQEKILKILDAQKRNNNPTLPPPGSVFSLAEPGVLELKISVGNSSKRFITSVDAVADSENDVLKEANGLFAYLRGIGKGICNSKTFFGIEKATN